MSSAFQSWELTNYIERKIVAAIHGPPPSDDTPAPTLAQAIKVNSSSSSCFSASISAAHRRAPSSNTKDAFPSKKLRRFRLRRISLMTARPLTYVISRPLRARRRCRTGTGVTLKGENVLPPSTRLRSSRARKIGCWPPKNNENKKISSNKVFAHETKTTKKCHSKEGQKRSGSFLIVFLGTQTTDSKSVHFTAPKPVEKVSNLY